MREDKLVRRFKGRRFSNARRQTRASRRTRARTREARESCYQSAARWKKSWRDRKADVCKVNLDRDTESPLNFRDRRSYYRIHVYCVTRKRNLLSRNSLKKDHTRVRNSEMDELLFDQDSNF